MEIDGKVAIVSGGARHSDSARHSDGASAWVRPWPWRWLNRALGWSYTMAHPPARPRTPCTRSTPWAATHWRSRPTSASPARPDPSSTTPWPASARWTSWRSPLSLRGAIATKQSSRWSTALRSSSPARGKTRRRRTGIATSPSTSNRPSDQRHARYVQEERNHAGRVLRPHRTPPSQLLDRTWRDNQ